MTNHHPLDRRTFLLAGGLGAFGPALSRPPAVSATSPSAARRRRNGCVFLFLFGGPSHIDLWDMKPDAPAEVRGEFKPDRHERAGHPASASTCRGWPA